MQLTPKDSQHKELPHKELSDKSQWYVVQVLSGQEQKIRENILYRIDTEEMADTIFDVLIPTERVQEIKRGKKTETTRKFFPGYLIINMDLYTEDKKIVDKAWYFIQDTQGVIAFAGNRQRPSPLQKKEVDNLLVQMKEREDTIKPKITFEVGDKVKVADGPFQSQNGVVEEIDPERGKLRVSVSIFGRDTPVELEYWQVERA